MKKAKILALSLSICLLLSVFAACGETPKVTTGEETASKTETSDIKVSEIETTATETETTIIRTEATITETETTATETETTVTETEITFIETETTATEPTATETGSTVTETETTVIESETAITETTVIETETTATETETETETKTEIETETEIIYSEGLRFTSNGDGTCYVSGIGSCEDTEIIIPKVTSSRQRVTGIAASAFYNNPYITSVTIPEGVEFIGAQAFRECLKLSQVTIPESVTEIKHWAFAECPELSSITIPDRVQSIGADTFNGCENLSSVIIGKSIKSIGSSAFYNCKALRSITLPDSVEIIDHNAFSGCRNLTHVEIGNGIKFINGSVFSDCTKLVYNRDGCCNYLGNETNKYAVFMGVTDQTVETVELKNGIKVIYSGAFYECSKLKEIVIPNGVVTIGDNTFVLCTSLNSVTLPDSLESIDVGAFFYCTNLKSITIPKNVSFIGSYTFYECAKLQSVIFENPEGWRCIEDILSETSGKKILSADLQDRETAAAYLVSTYIDHDWIRSDDLSDETECTESEENTEPETESTETETETQSETETHPTYTITDLPFVAHCDYIGENAIGKGTNSNSTDPCEIKKQRLPDNNELAISGWCIIEGGVSKYVWSIDGGQTWNDVGGTRNYGNSDMLSSAQNTLNYTFESEFTLINAHFQGCGTLRIDLSEYSGESLNIIIAAVPLNDENTIAYLFQIIKLKCN